MDLIEALHGKVTFERKNSELEAENKQLQKKVGDLEARVARLEEAGGHDESGPLIKTA